MGLPGAGPVGWLLIPGGRQICLNKMQKPIIKGEKEKSELDKYDFLWLGLFTFEVLSKELIQTSKINNDPKTNKTT